MTFFPFTQIEGDAEEHIDTIASEEVSSTWEKGENRYFPLSQLIGTHHKSKYRNCSTFGWRGVVARTVPTVLLVMVPMQH